MWRDGICEVERGLFSQTVSFSDVSYQSARQEAQEAIFSACCQLYDSFGADTSLQLSVANTPIPAEEVGNRAFFDDSDPVTGSESSKNARRPISSAGIGVLATESCRDVSAPNES